MTGIRPWRCARARNSAWRAGAMAWPLCAGGAALAQPVEADPPAATVVITGARASAASAEERRRSRVDIVDAVVAADIHKLPDLSVADALQRLPGLQITRDRGEGSAFSVRGLTQVQTTLNGRELFTAGGGRTLDPSDLPSEMLAGIDVAKSAAAEQIEGGLGGSVDLRTRRPFDFAGAAGVLSARLIHGHLVGRSAGQGSLLASWRGPLAGAGQAGLLVNAVLQERAFREDQKNTGNPQLRTDLLPGQPVTVPSGTSETASAGTRRRRALSVVGQWRPAPGTELAAEAHVAELRTRQDSQQINVGTGTGFDPASVQLFEGTQDLRRITWIDAPVSILSFARDTLDRTQQAALSGRRQAGDWTLAAELGHARSDNRLYFAGPFFAARSARFTQDLSGRVPATSMAGTDLLDPAQIRYTGVAYRVRPFHGELSTARADAHWHGAGNGVERVALGWRSAVRRAHNAPGLVFGDAPITALGAADTPDRIRPDPYAPTMDGRAPSLGDFLTGTLDDARDPDELRRALGIGAPLPQAGNPLGVWHIRERTDAAYLQLDWRADARVRGHAGLRAVRTHEQLEGSQSVPSAGGLAPLQVDSRYVDWLPSAALLWQAGDAWQWRAAASRTITRPNFDQLSPSLTLVPNPVNPELNTGGAGNPGLRPIRSRNLDLALESATGRAAAWSATLFWKHVDGFIASESRPETWDGSVYQVTRPYNSDPARVRGLELSGLCFGSGAWRVFGLQANASFVHSATFDRRRGAEVPLQNQSRRSANLVGLFEHGPWNARLAWNWRSRYLGGTANVVGLGAIDQTVRAYGWLDGALQWRPSEHVTLSLEGGNLLRSVRTAYNGVPTRPLAAWMNDRQWALAVGLRL